MGTVRTCGCLGGTVAALAAVLLLAGCSGAGHVEGSLTYPPPAAQPPAPPGVEPPSTPAPRAPEEPPPPAGVYFLHEQDYGVEDCLFIGERVTGSGPAATGSLEGEQARARAVLDMADQARWMGGNVVLLPHFREDYHAGRLVGRVYRCPEPQRRSIYERASAAGALTIVPR